MATRKRTSRPQPRHTPPKARAAPRKMRRSLWILLICAGIIGLILTAVEFYAQFREQPPNESEKAAAPPSVIPNHQVQLIAKTMSRTFPHPPDGSR
ncbi:MAG: hypothetical protein O7E52_04380 [Candidatus Poribacteria bacterium]|nr:hypothetical protein [Candidatus Poribacteria bacterium]